MFLRIPTKKSTKNYSDEIIRLKEKLDKDPRFKKYLRENSNWYTELNRDPSSYDKFVKDLTPETLLTVCEVRKLDD